MPIRRVAVIGAGLAGLAAAFRLARAGLDVVVLEREAHAGGRAAPADVLGLRVDPTGAVVRAGDPALRTVLAELDPSPALDPLPDGSVAQGFEHGVAPIDATCFAGIARIPGVGRLTGWRAPRLDRIRERFEALLDPMAPERAARLDDRSAADFARLYFGTRAHARWVEPQLSHATGLDAEQTSRVAFLLRGAPGDGATLARLRDGVGDLIARLCAGVALRTGVSVESIEPAANGLRVVSREGRGTHDERADAVVVATPAGETLRVAAPLLVPAERDVLQRAQVLPALALVVGLAEPPRPKLRRVVVPAAEQSPLRAMSFQEVAASSAGIETVAVLLSTARFAAREMDAPSESIEKALLAASERFCPGLASGLVITQLVRWESAIPCFPPGRLREIARLRAALRDRRAQGRRLHLAGDHLVSPSIDGALASGLRAASDLLADARSR